MSCPCVWLLEVCWRRGRTGGAVVSCIGTLWYWWCEWCGCVVPVACLLLAGCVLWLLVLRHAATERAAIPWPWAACELNTMCGLPVLIWLLNVSWLNSIPGLIRAQLYAGCLCEWRRARAFCAQSVSRKAHMSYSLVLLPSPPYGWAVTNSVVIPLMHLAWLGVCWGAVAD